MGAGALAVVLLVTMARRLIDHVVLYDELLHILSAAKLLESGRPAILDGLYERAYAFTTIVASFFEHFGRSPVSARLPALMFAIILLLLFGSWVARRAGFIAGLFTALVLVLIPATSELAVFARFYTFHAVVIAIIGIAVFEASLAGRGLVFRVAIGGLVIGLSILGMHLQETTVIALGGVLAGCAAVQLLERWSQWRPVLLKYPVQLSIVGLILLVASAGAAHVLGLTDRLAEAPLWASYSAFKPQYYLLGFSDSMPLLWPMFIFLLPAAWFWNQRLTAFCLASFAAAFIVHSIAAQKSVRYIYYALPFFSAIWGCGIAGLIGFAEKFLVHDTKVPGMARSLLLMLIVGVLILSLEGQRALKVATGKTTPSAALPYAVEADWSSAVEELKAEKLASQRLMTSNSMKAIYYLGGYDYELNASIVAETESGTEFGRDERTGRQAIGSPASVANVLGMPGRTLVVLEQETLNLASGVSSEALSLIESRCQPIKVSPIAALSAWTCEVTSGHEG